MLLFQSPAQPQTRINACLPAAWTMNAEPLACSRGGNLRSVPSHILGLSLRVEKTHFWQVFHCLLLLLPHLLIAFHHCTCILSAHVPRPNFHCPFEVQDRLLSPGMFKSAVRKSNPPMDPPPPYDVSPPASQRNSTDFTQLDEAEAETEPLTSNAPTTEDSSASEHREIPVQQRQYNRGCCNIMSEDGCLNVFSTGGCCNWESTGGCCNIR
jgi:hypothetical protein